MNSFSDNDNNNIFFTISAIDSVNSFRLILTGLNPKFAPNSIN